jgi:large subunit ribosomal protein L5
VGNAKALETSMNELQLITGQKPRSNLARRAISNFKLRAGMAVGCSVTLRGERMYEFLDRLVNVAIPRIRDFRGIPTKSFDGRGNYNLGIQEQIIFPEIDYDSVESISGLDIAIVTSARTDEEGLELLREMGMPFRRD